MTTQDQISDQIEPAIIESQLARITESMPFSRSNQMCRFLTFVVESTLKKQLDSLKEVCIGSMVFGRTPSYDPKIDPVVRVEARRLRVKLREYYEGAGATDDILIRLPKGGYRPVFERRSYSSEGTANGGPRALQADTPPATISVPVSSIDTNPAIHRHQQRSLPRLSLLAIACVLVPCMIVVFWRGHRVAAARITHLTNFVGEEFDGALSPDGRYLTFVWDGDGSNFDIYVRALPSGDPIRLTTNAAHDLHPAWSPDGRDIAFLRVSSSGSQVVIIPSTGGPERFIGEVHSSVSVWKADAAQIPGSLGPIWSPDGQALIVSDKSALYYWPLAFGERRQLTFPSTAENDFYPAISRDGRTLAWVRQTSNSTTDIYSSELVQPSKSTLRLTHDRADIVGLNWTPDNNSLLFSSSREGMHSIWRVLLADGRIEQMFAQSDQAVQPSVASRNNALIFTELLQNTNIWRVSISNAGQVKPGSPVRLIASSRRNNSPQYSPDNQQIAFISDRTGNWELWTCRSDGSIPRQLTNFRGPMLGTPHWSPDGRSIAFDARPNEHSAIFVVRSSGGNAKRINDNSFEERMPNWSPDGKYLYFNSTRDGSVRLWRMNLSGGELVRITDRAAYDNFTSADGKTIYFRSDGAGVWKISADGTRETFIPALATVQPSRYLAVSSRSLYFVDQEDFPRTIKAYDFGTAQIRTITQIERNLVSGTPSLSVSPDERYLLFAQQDSNGSDIVMVSDDPTRPNGRFGITPDGAPPFTLSFRQP